MKILIDGHNLGLKEPTGIGVYAKNLANCLNSLNHEVSVLYGINHSFKWWLDYDSQCASFYQKLFIKGEESAKGFIRRPFSFFRFLPNCIFGLGISSTKVGFPSYKIDLKGIEKKLPPNIVPYNSPNIFRSAQAFAAVTGRSFPLSKPKNGLDVLHLTLPLPIKKSSKFKKVVTVHDVIPLKIPESTSINLKQYQKILKASIRDADQIFCISERTKLDLMEVLKIKEDKIHLTSQMSFIPEIIKDFPDKFLEPLLGSYKLKRNKYFIFYGAIEPKKNVLKIISAFKNSHSDSKLVIVGKNGWLFDKEQKIFDEIQMGFKSNNNFYKRILRIPYLEFLDLMILLKGARALIFPSRYEGFGLPILEAMQMGVPVITSNMAPMNEVGGDAPYYVDPYSTLDLISAIEKFSESDNYLREFKLKGLKQAEKFSKEKYLKKLELGYKKLFK